MQDHRLHQTLWYKAALFVFLTYGISYGIWLGAFTAWLSPNPTWEALHLWGGLGPLMAAILLTLILKDNGHFTWPATWLHWGSLSSWAICMGSLLALLMAGLVATHLADHKPLSVTALLTSPNFPSFTGLTLITCEIIFFGFGEELGWRGYLMPLLEKHMTPLLAATVTGLIWAAWHLPLMFLNQTYGGFDMSMLGGWFISLMLGAYLMSWLMRYSRSIAVVAVFHGLLDIIMVNNSIGQAGMIAQGALISILGLLALISLWRNPKRALT